MTSPAFSRSNFRSLRLPLWAMIIRPFLLKSGGKLLTPLSHPACLSTFDQSISLETLLSLAATAMLDDPALPTLPSDCVASVGKSFREQVTSLNRSSFVWQKARPSLIFFSLGKLV